MSSGTKRRIDRKVVYGAAVVALLAVVSGYAMGATSVNHQSQQSTATQVTVTTNVTGLTSLRYSMSQGFCFPCGQAAFDSVVNLSSGATFICMTYPVCNANVTEGVEYTYNTSFAASAQVRMVGFLQGSPSTQFDRMYFQQPATPVSGILVVLFDVGGENTVNSVSLAFTQCGLGNGGALSC